MKQPQPTIDIGSLVILKTDRMPAPTLTVVALANNCAQCFWFNNNLDLKDAFFPLEALLCLEDNQQIN